jgi:hypothetical protein
MKPNNHKEGCMCDACIIYRVSSAVSKRDQDEAQRQYEARRGGKIGSISVSEALGSKANPSSEPK